MDKIRGRCSVGVTVIELRDEMLLSEQSRVSLAIVTATGPGSKGGRGDGSDG